jgi:hypothetical protein
MRRLVLLLLALWAGLADRTVLPGLLEGGQPACRPHGIFTESHHGRIVRTHGL